MIKFIKLIFIISILFDFSFAGENEPKEFKYKSGYKVKKDMYFKNKIKHFEYKLVGVKSKDNFYNKIALVVPDYNELLTLLDNRKLSLLKNFSKSYDLLTKIVITQYSNSDEYLSNPICNGFYNQSLEFIIKKDNILYFDNAYSEFACGAHPYGGSTISMINSKTGEIIKENKHQILYRTNNNYKKAILKLAKDSGCSNDYLADCYTHPLDIQTLTCSGCTTAIPSFELDLKLLNYK